MKIDPGGKIQPGLTTLPSFGTSGLPAPHLTPAFEQSLRHPGLTDPALQSRFGETYRANRFTLRVATVELLTVDRPTIIYPIGVPTAILYYQARTRPAWSSAAVPGASAWDAPLKSKGAGICYLATKGEWFVYYNGAAALECALIPAEDPGVAAKYLAETGSHTASTPALGHFDELTASPVIAANRDRTALLIQNTSGSGGATIQVGLGALPTAGIAPAGTGIRLGNNASLLLSGDSLFKGAVYITAVTGWDADCLEFT